MFSASRINLTLISQKEQVIDQKKREAIIGLSAILEALERQRYDIYRLFGGKMDYDLKILYPVKSLYESKKKAFFNT